MRYTYTLYCLLFFKKNYGQAAGSLKYGLFIALLTGIYVQPIFSQDTCTDISIVADGEICSGEDFTLDVIFPIFEQYTVDQTGTFSPIAGIGTVVNLGEDEMSGALPIGFTFPFYGSDYTEFAISSNGFVTFDVANPLLTAGCCAGQLLPDPTNPDNLIAMAWEDLDPSAGTGGGTIDYFTTGTAPNQILVVNFNNVQHFDDNSPLTPPNTFTVTTQLLLYESTGIIEIHTTEMNSDGGPHTMGIENQGGTGGLAVPGRNAADWSAMNDFVAFVPNGFTNCDDNVAWTNDQDATVLTGKTQTVNPTTTTIYTATMDCGMTCTQSVTVTVDATPPMAVCQDVSIALGEDGAASIDFGTALAFDGVDDYVEVADNSALQWTGNITVEAWIKPSATGGDYNTIINKMSNTAQGFILEMGSSQGANDLKMRWLVGSGTVGIFGQVVAAEPLVLNEWAHVAGTYDGTMLHLYINGQLAGSTAYSGGLDTDQGLPLVMGAPAFSAGAGESFEGIIDEVRLWDVAHSQADIQAYMHQSTVVLNPPASGYWSFDDGTGSAVATDSGTASSDGTLTNMDVNTAWVIGYRPFSQGSSDNCGVAAITANPAIFDCALLGANVVAITVADGTGNTTACSTTVTVFDEILPNASCQDLTVSLDNSGNVTIAGTDINSGSTDNCTLIYSAMPANLTCAVLGTPQTVMLMVTDGLNNSTTCQAMITVQDDIAPMAVCQNITIDLNGGGNATIQAEDIDAGSSDNCGFTLTAQPTAFSCINLNDNAVTLFVTDESGNVATCISTVHINDPFTPTPQCQNITIELDNTGNVGIQPSDIDNGTDDNCDFTMMLMPNAFGCAEIGSNTVTLSALDAAGNEGTCSTTVVVEDNIVPTPKCQDATIELDIAGNVMLMPSDVDNHSSDNCNTTLSVSPNLYNCSHILSNNVATLMTIDEGGNTTNCTATITIQDNIPATPVCKDITIELDNDGNAAILPSEIDNGTTDNCVFTLTAAPTSFTCLDLENNVTTLFVRDEGGNITTCTSTIHINDPILPTPKCQDITIELDNTGNVAIVADDVDHGSTDNCSFTLAVLQNTFTCNELGDNTVTLIAIDADGNENTCTAVVTVEDNILPTPKCQDIVIELDANGEATITAADIDNNSTDNCDFTLSVFPTNYNTSNLDILNTAILTSIDEGNNTATCTANVTVLDNIPPHPICQDITIELDNSGNVMIVGTDLDDGSTDNSIMTFTAQPNAFDCTHLGNNTSTLFVEDEGGNVVTCMATVQVNDVILPTPKCQNITVALDNMGLADIVAADVDNGSSDNCAFTLSVLPNTFVCEDMGDNTVTLTSVDEDGNQSTCEAVVTVQDLILPTPKCQDITIQLDVNGEATITPNDADNGSTDNCDFTLAVLPTSYQCANVGDNLATLTATDEFGNIANCTSTITVQDNVTPVALCQDITIELDNIGLAAIVADDIDNGSNDACGIANLVVFPNAFTETHLGDNTVTLTVTDINTNTSTCNTIVAIKDNIIPTVTCANNIEECNNTDGFMFYDDPIATSNSQIVSLYNIPASGSVFPIGESVVTGYAVDIGGNTGTCTFMINYAPLQLDITLSDYDGFGVSCNNGMDGTITANPLTGLPPYTYLWSDGQTTQTATNLSAGFYSVTVTGNNGTCSIIKSTLLTGLPTLVCPITGTDISCSGFNNGLATTQVSGGIGSYAFTWAGPNGFTSTNEVISGLAPGDYQLTVTDLGDCACTQMVTIEEPLPLTITNDLMLAPEDSPFQLANSSLTICGGIPPYDLEWTTDGPVFYVEKILPNGCVDATVVFVEGASWSVLITDNNGCTEEASFIPDDPNFLLLTGTITTPAMDCQGGDGAIELIVVGGTLPYSFDWEGPIGWTPPPLPSGPSLFDLPSGWYSVEITDASNPPQRVQSWIWVNCEGGGGVRGKNEDSQNLAQIGVVEVFPNPASELTTLLFHPAQTANTSIRIMDVTGKQIANLFEGMAEKGELYQLPYNVTHLAAGVYAVMIQIEGQSTVLVEKIVVAK